MEPTRRSFKKISIVIGIIVILIIIAAAHYAIRHRQSATVGTGYQAVFLTNNQVYFGKVSSLDSKYVSLTDIYYIQLTQALQSQSQTNTAPQNLNLVKLGSELHGPTDKMLINRDQILFIEDLKSDSQVVSAITNYKKTNGR